MSQTKPAPTAEDQAAADALIRHINRNMGSQPQLAAALAQTHPTLQQGLMRLFVAFVREMAAKTYVDARNEASKHVAEAIVYSWEQEYGPSDNYGPRGPYLPLI